MDIANSIFVSAVDYLKHEVLAGLGARLYDGRYVDEFATGLLPGDRLGSKAPISVAATLQAPGRGFVPGDEMWVRVSDGYEIKVPGPVDLAEVSLDGFRAWLGEVKASAKRWS